MKDLLPGPKNELAIGDGRRERWFEQRGLQVRMTAPVALCLLMTVIAAGRDEFV